MVVPAAAVFAELAGCGRPATTQRSYGMDLLRWFRFVWVLQVDWDQATRVEARDFCRQEMRANAGSRSRTFCTPCPGEVNFFIARSRCRAGRVCCVVRSRGRRDR